MSDKKSDSDHVMAAVGTGVTVAAAPMVIGAVLALPVALPAALAAGATVGILKLFSSRK